MMNKELKKFCKKNNITVGRVGKGWFASIVGKTIAEGRTEIEAIRNLCKIKGIICPNDSSETLNQIN